MKKLRRILCLVIAIVALCSAATIMVSAAQKQTIYSSPYVTFAPDGNAWTTNAGNQDIKWYERGTIVSTGISSVIRELQAGEHYYLYDRTGEIPIGKWQVGLGQVNCCHNSYPSDFHDISYARSICFRNHYSGWLAYCADCEQKIEKAYIYMSEEAAKSIDYFEIRDDLDYYYLCPFCSNLEQAVGFEGHECKAISWNQYKVVYDVNILPSERYGGYMQDSIHMYNNATEYEGKPVTPVTHLTKNTYTRIGYEFVEWNSEPDGSGKSFSDGEEISNLSSADWNDTGTWTESDKGTVTLYAQWRKSSSTLNIDPNGGSYNNKSAITTVAGNYGDSYKILKDEIKAPKGYKVTFNTNGGNSVAPITSTRHFTEYSMENPFNGRIKEDTYYFIAPDGNVDTVVLQYELDSITLPECTKQGSTFGGWYYDSECTKPAGSPGDQITPPNDVTLYAAWVDLKLFSEDNYVANDGKGAVDLSWTQSDLNSKIYKIYQSRDNATWKLITSADDIGNQTVISENFSYSGSGKTYTAPYSGIYTLTAYGAQGGDYGSYKGGFGGSVTARVWLKEGEEITYTIGGQKGYNGGGTGSVYGNGGGSTIIKSDRQGTLLIAGGGGGASANGNGGAGGSATSLRADKNSTGASGQTGGGAGYVGGNAGEYVVHNCEDSCYTTNSGTNTAGVPFYASSTASATGNGQYEIAKSTDSMSAQMGTRSQQDTAKGTLNVGNSVAYFNTPYSGKLTFSVSNASNGFSGVWNLFDDTSFKVYVYDKDTNAVLYQASSADLKHTESLSTRVMCDRSSCTLDYHQQKITTWSYNHTSATGTVTGKRIRHYLINWTNHDGTARGQVDEDLTSLKFTVPIPASTNGIYIKCTIDVSGGRMGANYGLTVSDVSYSYENKTKTCGYTDGQVISSKPAYGGSSYVNTSAAYEYSQNAGVRSGNGAFSLDSEAIGFMDVLALDGVIATDYAAPDSISAKSVTKEATSGTQVKVTWQEPDDNGTDYYHVAESYLPGSDEPLCRSNVTKNTLSSGIKGYYVLTDTKASTVVTASNGYFTSKNSRVVDTEEQITYVHVVAVDKAGNIGGTVHIELDPKAVTWKLYTEQLSIEEGDNVYPVEEGKKWYVRADGNTPFTLQYKSYMDGQATAEYQPNYIIYESVLEGISSKNIVYSPSAAIQDGIVKTDAEELSHSVEGQSMLIQYPYSYTIRSEKNKKLQGVQAFMLDSEASGKSIKVIPIAGVDYDKEILYSDYDADKKNSITIIGDGKAPNVSGLEILENKEVINRNAGTIVLNVTATDDLSGVKDFYVEITNTDNGNNKKYTPGAYGSIRIEITKEEPIFTGNFQVYAYAVDNVGNEIEMDYGTTEFALSATIERILAPHDPIFKCGESGILTISTYGYAEKVEVEFPPEMAAFRPELNQVFDYAGEANYVQTEKIQFMIPLDTPTNTLYTIRVRAYKGDKCLEKHPTLSTIEVAGSVLDEFRTRLR